MRLLHIGEVKCIPNSTIYNSFGGLVLRSQGCKEDLGIRWRNRKASRFMERTTLSTSLKEACKVWTSFSTTPEYFGQAHSEQYYKRYVNGYVYFFMRMIRSRHKHECCQWCEGVTSKKFELHNEPKTVQARPKPYICKRVMSFSTSECFTKLICNFHMYLCMLYDWFPKMFFNGEVKQILAW